MNTLVGAARLCLAPARSRGDASRVELSDRVPPGPVRDILSAHIPADDTRACACCGFEYTLEKPLCPLVAATLRRLVVTTPTNPLLTLTPGRLHRISREHTGTGRCRRCGFVYSSEVRTCPTARRITAELERRGLEPLSQPDRAVGLCAGRSNLWEATETDPAHWRRAMAACRACPLLAQCEKRVEQLVTQKTPPRMAVAAGMLFNVRGEVVPADKVMQYAISRGHVTKLRPGTGRRRVPSAVVA